jgi:hypothetical protein
VSRAIVISGAHSAEHRNVSFERHETPFVACADTTLICNQATAISNSDGSGRMDISRFLIVFGLVILSVGVLWPIIGKLGLGRLPGDIVIERDGFSFYFPITTGLLVSAFISALLWLVSR